MEGVRVGGSLTPHPSSDRNWRKIVGVIGRRGLRLGSSDLFRRIPLSTKLNLGMGTVRGSGRSLEICKYLTAARYVLIVLYAKPELAK